MHSVLTPVQKRVILSADTGGAIATSTTGPTIRVLRSYRLIAWDFESSRYVLTKAGWAEKVTLARLAQAADTWARVQVTQAARAELDASLTEDDLLTRVLDLARLRGWKVVHYRPAKTAKGWRTPLQGDKGCPDVILARNGVVILAELKSDTGKATPEQRQWLAQLGDHGHLWRPRDWPRIAALLH
jgi:hypothetical protein